MYAHPHDFGAGGGGAYASVHPSAFFGEAASETSGMTSETPDMMFDGASADATSRVAATAAGAGGKIPISAAAMARSGAVDYGAMYATVAHKGDSMGLETSNHRIMRDGAREAARVAALVKPPSQIAIHVARDSAIPESRKIRPARQYPRGTGAGTR